MDAKERLDLICLLEGTADGCSENEKEMKELLLTAKKCIEELEETVACLNESNAITRKDLDYKVSVIEQRNRMIDEQKKQIELMQVCANCGRFGSSEWSDQNEPCKNKECDGKCSRWVLWEV